MTYTWHDIRYRRSVYCDRDGRIVGSVEGLHGGVVARAQASEIGTYLSRGQAKSAVERVFANDPLGQLAAHSSQPEPQG